MGAGSFDAGLGFAGHDPITILTALVANAPAGSPKFDPLSKTYPLLADGSVDSVDPVWQEVAHRLGIPLGSLSFAPDVGIDIDAIKQATPATAKRTVGDVVKRALAPMLARGDVEIVRIVIGDPWRGKYDVHVKNLRNPGDDPTVFTSA